MKKPGTDLSSPRSADHTSQSSHAYAVFCLDLAVYSQQALGKAPRDAQTAKQWPVGQI